MLIITAELSVLYYPVQGAVSNYEHLFWWLWTVLVEWEIFVIFLFLSKKLKVSLYLKRKKNLPRRVLEDQFFNMGLYILAV